MKVHVALDRFFQIYLEQSLMHGNFTNRIINEIRIEINKYEYIRKAKCLAVNTAADLGAQL